MLAIRCQFLQGVFQASPPGRYDEAEWPPHPARLHAALVAAGWASGDGAVVDAALAALRWLESAGAPAIAVPRAHERTPVDVFVPRNLTSRELGAIRSAVARGDDPSRQAGRVDRGFPAMTCGDEPVWFVWQRDPGEHRDVLERLVREVQYLGSSRSPVCCDVVDGAPGADLGPVDRRGSHALRVARGGYTDRLLRARWSFPPPSSGPSQSYGRPAGRQVAVAAGPFSELVVLRLPRACSLTARDTPAVTAAMRAAILALAGDGAPPVLHGHGRHPHVAFLALSAVGHPHADAGLRGLALALPDGLDSDERAAVLRSSMALRELRVAGRGRWTVEPASGGETLRTLDPARWTGPARRWRTVTPIVLDRHPKRRDEQALEAAIRITLDHAGVPAPLVVDASPASFLPAAPHAGELRGDRLEGLRLHVELRYEHPVRGPLLAGRLRYFGVGLLAPDREDPR